MANHDGPHRREIVQALQAEPESFRAGFAVAFASQKPAQTGHQTQGVSQGRRVSRRHRILRPVGSQGFPFGFFVVV